ncbi:MAG TPA: hypothetical protein VGM41_18970 [Chitinophagaceae bacterium]|jgi:hypothetical protein
MQNKLPAQIVLAFIFLFTLSACAGFRFGSTWSQSRNTYSLVTADKDNFGNKRVRYNRQFHHKSQLDYFLNYRGLPAFIYEYQSPEKCRGIRLYYPAIDSVFIFEEPRKWNLKSVMKVARKMYDDEHQAYDKLRQINSDH